MNTVEIPKYEKIPPRRIEPLRNKLRKEYHKNFSKSYDLPFAVYVSDLMRDLIKIKDANKVLKTYYNLHEHLHTEPEKDKEHLEPGLDFFDKVKKKKKVDVVVKITNKEVS